MKKTSRLNVHHQSSEASLLDDWLAILGVAHTRSYTLKREKEMPFKTWFGLSRVLQDYGIQSEAFSIPDKKEILTVVPPFIAHTSGDEGGNVIVKSISNDGVVYLSMGVEKTTGLEKFLEAWDGNIFISSPKEDAIEPDFRLHRRLEYFTKSKKWILGLCMLLLFAYAFITNGLYKEVSTWFIVAIDIGGIYVTYLLVQKSLKIKNKKADRFCGVLQEGGCDDILDTSASKFFGLFGWSEVGFSYFTVSLLALLMFPASLPSLALCNLCCLPFTFWSIWYQRFKAGRWCTLCVTVQCSLWLLFFSYLAGGWLRLSFPIKIDFFVLGITYLGVMLMLNAVMPLMQKDNNGSKSDKI